MLLFHTVLILVIIGCTHGEGEENKEDDEEQSAPRVINDKANVEKASDLFPYEIGEEFTTPYFSWADGFLYKKPVFATIYDPSRYDLRTYLFPPQYCSVVWICFTKTPNTTSAGVFNFDFAAACENSLRFHTLEQIVYIVKDNFYEMYPYYSPLVELISVQSSTSHRFAFMPHSEFDLEDFSDVKQDIEITFQMAESRILLLTTSPYCHATFQRRLQGVADGHVMNFMPLDSGKYLLLGHEAEAQKGPYFLTGSKEGSQIQSQMWANNPSIAFDPPDRRRTLKKAVFDCCAPTWEFENFVTGSEWNTNSFITYHRYTLHKHSRSGCADNPKEATNSMFQSILLEVGETCEWLRICFDNRGEFCTNDGNSLSFIFIHDLYIPTDSNEARPIAVSFNKLDPIRINFFLGARGLELSYAFSSFKVAGITEMMQLSVYDGMDPSRIEINMVKSPHCEARLLNDMGAVDIHKGTEAGLQCISISSCTCLE